MQKHVSNEITLKVTSIINQIKLVLKDISQGTSQNQQLKWKFSSNLQSCAHNKRSKVKYLSWDSMSVLWKLEIKFFYVLKPNSKFCHRTHISKGTTRNIHQFFINLVITIIVPILSMYTLFRDRTYVISFIHKNLLNIHFSPQNLYQVVNIYFIHICIWSLLLHNIYPKI